MIGSKKSAAFSKFSGFPQAAPPKSYPHFPHTFPQKISFFGVGKGFFRLGLPKFVCIRLHKFSKLLRFPHPCGKWLWKTRFQQNRQNDRLILIGSRSVQGHVGKIPLLILKIARRRNHRAVITAKRHGGHDKRHAK